MSQNFSCFISYFKLSTSFNCHIWLKYILIQQGLFLLIFSMVLNSWLRLFLQRLFFLFVFFNFYPYTYLIFEKKLIWDTMISGHQYVAFDFTMFAITFVAYIGSFQGTSSIADLLSLHPMSLISFKQFSNAQLGFCCIFYTNFFVFQVIYIT